MDSAANPTLLVVIGALWTIVLGLIAWWAKTLRDDVREVKHGQATQGKTLVRIETALFGAQGDNGLNGDMKDMKAWRHKEGNRRHSILARLFRLEEHNGLEPMPTQAGE